MHAWVVSLKPDTVAGDSAEQEGTRQKAAGLQRVEELMRVVVSAEDPEREVDGILIPLLEAVQSSSKDVVAVHDRAVYAILREVWSRSMHARRPVPNPLQLRTPGRGSCLEALRRVQSEVQAPT